MITVTISPDALSGAAEISNMNPRIGDTLTGSLTGGVNNPSALVYALWHNREWLKTFMGSEKK